MRKILVGLIAAMMLFAFTACEPSSMTVNNVNGVPVAATITSSGSFYAGTSANNTPVVVSVTYDNGYVLENVNAKLASTGNVKAGTNYGTVSIPVADSSTGSALDVSFTGIAATELRLALDEDVKVEYAKADITSETATIDTDGVTATLVYADGHERTLTSDVSYKFNGTAAASYQDSTAVIATVTGTNLTADDKDLTAEYAIEVTDYTAPATTVTVTWNVQVADEDGEYTNYNSSSNKPSILWGETKSDLLANIRVLATTTTKVGNGAPTTTTEVLTQGSDYQVYGIPSGELKTAGSFTVVPLVDTTGTPAITFSDTTVSYDVVDDVDWNSLSVTWAETPKNLKVEGTLSTTSGDDVVVSLKKLSGTAIDTGVTFSYIGVYSFPEEDFTAGQSVSPVVKVTYGDEFKTATLSAKALGAKA